MFLYEIWKMNDDGKYSRYTTFNMKTPAYDYVVLLRSKGVCCSVNEVFVD